MSVIAIGAVDGVSGITAGLGELGTTISAGVSTAGVGALIVGAGIAGFKLGNLIGDAISKAKQAALAPYLETLSNIDAYNNAVDVFSKYWLTELPQDALQASIELSKKQDQLDFISILNKPLSNVIGNLNKNFLDVISFYIANINELPKVKWQFDTVNSDLVISGLFQNDINETQRQYNNLLNTLKKLGLIGDFSIEIIRKSNIITGIIQEYVKVNIKPADPAALQAIIDFITNLSNLIILINKVLDNIYNEVLQIIATTITTTPQIVIDPSIDDLLSGLNRGISGLLPKEYIHPDIVLGDAFTESIYQNWVDRLTRNATTSQTISQSITRTQTRTTTENAKLPRWRLPKDKRQNQKQIPKEITFIDADVSLRSEWISKVRFKFSAPQEPTSNSRGKLSFVLKNGNTYDIGVYTRGTFSYIVMMMFGTGYGWWSAIPKHKRRLTDIETISYNLPNPTTAKRLQAIAQELKEAGIHYS